MPKLKVNRCPKCCTFASLKESTMKVFHVEAEPEELFEEEESITTWTCSHCGEEFGSDLIELGYLEEDSQ